MRNPTLHAILQAFVVDASAQLSSAAKQGEEVPFELSQSGRGGRGRVPLYCYRPLTGVFIQDRLGRLQALETYAPAARALEAAGGIGHYLGAHGSRTPEGRRELADAALQRLLERTLGERSDFELDQDRFDHAYELLERSLYDGSCLVEVALPLLGIELDEGVEELQLAQQLAIVRSRSLPEPPESASAPLLLMVRSVQERSEPAAVAEAIRRCRSALSALRLFDRGSCGLGQLGYCRIDGGVWRAVAAGAGGHHGRPMHIPADREDELRAFCNLVARRAPAAGSKGSAAGGQLEWALRRFELGCERSDPLEALSDYLLALRALLEPEGSASGRLAQRLAVICAPAGEQAALAERIARTVELERAVIDGRPAPMEGEKVAERLVDELREHLRAILRDAVCGHLQSDVCALADDLLAEAAGVPALA